MKVRTLLIILLFFSSFFLQSQIINDTFSVEIRKQFSYKYSLYKPQETNSAKPLIVFLHGSGERGNDLEKLKIYGPLKYIESQPLDAFILAPLCPEGIYWESESLNALVEKIIHENPIDTCRIYLTGLSMGAWGAWNLAFARPHRFAALATIAGFVDRVPMIENCKIKDISIRIYHGLLDDVVSPDYSKNIYQRLQPCCKDLQLILFDDANHDSWTRVYSNPEFYKWMLSKTKQ